jgi:hypothetical protein
VPVDDPTLARTSPGMPWWRAFLGAFGVAGLTGIPLGVGWWLLAPRIRVVVTDSGAVFAPGNPSDWFGREGWFGVLGLVLGAGAGLLAHRWWGRRPLPALFGLCLGGLLAALLGYQLGRLLGPDALPSDLGGLPVGTVVGAPLKLIAPAVVLAVSFAAVLAFGLAVALERDDPAPADRVDAQPEGTRPEETGESDPALAR